MFVSRVVVSLRVPGLEKKSLVKITSLVHNCRMVEVYTMAKLVRVLRNLLFQGSVRLFEAKGQTFSLAVQKCCLQGRLR